MPARQSLFIAIKYVAMCLTSVDHDCRQLDPDQHHTMPLDCKVSLHEQCLELVCLGESCDYCQAKSGSMARCLAMLYACICVELKQCSNMAGLAIVSRQRGIELGDCRKLETAVSGRPGEPEAEGCKTRQAAASHDTG